jgi:hypothetical protein
LLAFPSAETPVTVKEKLICVLPIALAADTPLGVTKTFVIKVGDPIALAADTPLGVTVTGTRTVTDPIALAAETPVTLTVTGRLTVTEPTALAAETPVIARGSGLFQAPSFQVPLFQPVRDAIKKS